MIKAKRKHKWNMQLNLKNRIFDLFRPISVNFIVQQPPEECVARLESLDRQYQWRWPKTDITVTPMDDASYAFHIKQETKDGILRNCFLKANGYLWQWGENTTYVESEIGLYYGSIESMHIIGLLVFLPMIGLLQALFNLQSNFFLVCCVAVFSLVFGVIMAFISRPISRYDFVKMIKTALEY